ncbi:acyl-CoA synthetase family member 4 homolog [Spodoptera litura]|uniref:Acyl-CoA synthetase family member 4 homolog n=1 Tax=Spodoptera litura TaxID=69820 RepID=A0A9J7EJW7_SPOLT|nr:acyl-CoA synthetase family member 4 homolog [Spodoptera litura]
MKVKRGYYDVFVDTCAKYPSHIAVRHYVDGVYKTYTYSELYGVCEYLSQKLQLMQCNRGVIGLISERNIIIPCIIAAAHKNCTTFMFVDPTQNIDVIAKEIEFTIIMTIRTNDQDPNAEVFGKKPEQIVAVFDLIICFYNFDGGNEPHMAHVPQHSFIALTSGSTGEPKHIQVPIQCIQPNIDDLTKMFTITPQDVIFFSTPLTFDPSMVEILLACINGASLLIAPDRTDVLFPENKANSITIWQTTPSKFLQYSNTDIRDKILSQNSTLKILALGGEPFNGVKRIKELKHLHNQTKLFTLYGVTEMSCWACVAQLDLSTITTDREVPLGNCLSETEIIIEDNKENANTGKIILVSKSRKCVILNKSKGHEEQNSLKFLDTGDIGEVKSGTIYYRGRRDDIIKRFGHKVNLMNIEAAIMQCPRVKTCSCLWLPKPMLVAVYFSSETLSSQELSDFLKCKLDDKHWPDKIIRVDNLPTNSHGKVSKNTLCNMFEKLMKAPQTEDSIKVTFMKELKNSIGKNLIYDQIKNQDFFALGGTSFLAVSLCNNLSQTCPQFGKLILPYLMTQKHTIDEIMQIAYKQLCMDATKAKKRLKRARPESKTAELDEVVKKSSLESISSIEFTMIWKHDTGKCVDASPVLFQSGYNLYVTVGSHSGQIAVLDAITSEVQAKFLINSRIEAAVLCYYDPDITPPCGVVGGYDGTVICFCLDTFKENWRVNIGSMVKSKAVCVKGQLYVASYDGNVRCLDILTGMTNETINICDQAISADLVLAKKEYVILGSLSGVCASIHTSTNTVVWRGLLGSPVFASPVLYDKDKYVVFAEVSGDIHCRTVEKGIKIWKYQGAKGNVFSSLYIKQIDKLKWQMVFGCHDKGVYSLAVKNFQPTLHWKTQLTSPVYSTPCGLSDKLILAASNNGKLCILEAETGVLVEEYSLPNETFSTPVMYGDFIYVGCRDDHLYSIRYLFKS